jgi:hypothetical protein
MSDVEHAAVFARGPKPIENDDNVKWPSTHPLLLRTSDLYSESRVSDSCDTADGVKYVESKSYNRDSVGSCRAEGVCARESAAEMS